MNTLGERLVAESEALRDLLDGTGAVPLLVLVVVTFALLELVARLVRVARASGYDVGRRLAGARIAVGVAVGAWAASVVARHVLVRAPIVGTALLVLFAGGALFGLAVSLQRATGGVLLLLGQRVREGDRVTVGETTGTVEHAGLLRLRLRRADGAVVWLPTSQLAEVAVVVSSPRATRIVEVRLDLDVSPSGPDRERLRRVALSCPFREAATEVAVDDDAGRVRVSLRAWSAAAAIRAEEWLRSSGRFGGSEGAVVERSPGAEHGG